MLVDDFDEFRSLVEAPLARLKIKKFVKQKIGNSSTTQTNKVRTYFNNRVIGLQYIDAHVHDAYLGCQK